jgi:hypothetical protein
MQNFDKGRRNQVVLLFNSWVLVRRPDAKGEKETMELAVSEIRYTTSLEKMD